MRRMGRLFAGMVQSIRHSKRGQAFLNEMVTALARDASKTTWVEPRTATAALGGRTLAQHGPDADDPDDRSLSRCEHFRIAGPWLQRS